MLDQARQGAVLFVRLTFKSLLEIAFKPDIDHGLLACHASSLPDIIGLSIKSDCLLYDFYKTSCDAASLRLAVNQHICAVPKELP